MPLHFGGVCLSIYKMPLPQFTTFNSVGCAIILGIGKKRKNYFPRKVFTFQETKPNGIHLFNLSKKKIEPYCT